jgi:hypothetical protein
MPTSWAVTGLLDRPICRDLTPDCAWTAGGPWARRGDLELVVRQEVRSERPTRICRHNSKSHTLHRRVDAVAAKSRPALIPMKTSLLAAVLLPLAYNAPRLFRSGHHRRRRGGGCKPVGVALAAVAGFAGLLTTTAAAATVVATTTAPGRTPKAADTISGPVPAHGHGPGEAGLSHKGSQRPAGTSHTLSRTVGSLHCPAARH